MSGGDAITVRRARRADAEVIAAFNRAMAAETEGKSLDDARLQRGVEAVFEDEQRGCYWVAEAGGSVVGALMITREWSDWRDGWFWWVQSVYVLPEARRRGVYRRLYEQVLHAAEGAPEVCGMRLYVERNNARAQRVYESLGMEPTSYRLYEVGFASERSAGEAAAGELTSS